jgi:hypothetical protein
MTKLVFIGTSWEPYGCEGDSSLDQGTGATTSKRTTAAKKLLALTVTVMVQQGKVVAQATDVGP